MKETGEAYVAPIREIINEARLPRKIGRGSVNALIENYANGEAAGSGERWKKK